MCFFYFGVRVEVEDANERIFLWGQMQTGDFAFGIRIGVEDAKSLDLLHDFSLSVQTFRVFFFFFFFFFFVCFFFFCVQADAFCTWRIVVAKAGREKKKSRNSQTHHSEYSFLQRKNK